MTRLQRIAIEGFKGIDSLEFEPGAINIVTGRNNSGKTSLLESIDLSVDPSHVERFGENLDSVINYQHEESRITIDDGENVTELQLSRPRKREAIDWIFEATRADLYENWELLATDDMDRTGVNEVIDNELPALFSEDVEENILNNAVDGTIKLRINDEEYPYLNYGYHMGSLYGYAQSSIKSSIVDDPNMVDNEHEKWVNPFTYREKPGFVEGKAPSQGKTRFIDFVQLSKPFDLQPDEDDPIKIDDISDFLREKKIVDDLKTFDLDYLVFEDDDGEKYSVPFDHMGEGFKTLVGVLWHLFDVDGEADVVLLEEPNTHMHPGYVRQLTYFLVDLAREEEIQLFITTHNNDFLNDFFTENLKAEEREFLEEEFRLVQLQDGAADVMDYDEAEKQLKDLKLDLRGHR